MSKYWEWILLTPRHLASSWAILPSNASNLDLRTVCTTRHTPERRAGSLVAKGTPRLPDGSVRTGGRFCSRETTASAPFCCESDAGDRNPSQKSCFPLLSLYFKMLCGCMYFKMCARSRARLTINVMIRRLRFLYLVIGVHRPTNDVCGSCT
jgi:hypothetical protein